MFEKDEYIDKQYKVIDELGRGGMGAVLRVLDTTSEQEVALKYCLDTDNNSLRRFAREVRIMSSIKHTHVMPVLHENLDFQPPYFVMPVAKNSISIEIIEEMNEDSALTIFQEICLGVQAIHTVGATHRDLKPDNVMRMENNSIVVSDMGLAKLDVRDSTVLTQTMAFVGTAVYCAPEQQIPSGSREADSRTDIYQLGKLLYQLITCDSPALINTSLLPVGLSYIIDRATKQNPDQRYQSIGKLMDAVEVYSRSQAPNATPERSFDVAIQEATTLQKSDKYDSKNIKSILSLLLKFSNDNDQLLEQFDRVPLELLGIITRNFPEEFLPIFNEYSKAIEQVVGNYGFEYAEKVAGKMKVIFNNTTKTEIKVLALQSTMISAVRLHRYAAMESFDSLLLKIKTESDAMGIALMLRENIHCYSNLADRIPKLNLHETIRQVYDDALQLE